MRAVLVGSGFPSGTFEVVSAQCDLRSHGDQGDAGHRRDGEVLSQKNITARAPGTWRSAVMIATGNVSTEPTASEKRLVVLAGTPPEFGRLDGASQSIRSRRTEGLRGKAALWNSVVAAIVLSYSQGRAE